MPGSSPGMTGRKDLDARRKAGHDGRGLSRLATAEQRQDASGYLPSVGSCARLPHARAKGGCSSPDWSGPVPTRADFVLEARDLTPFGTDTPVNASASRPLPFPDDIPPAEAGGLL